MIKSTIKELRIVKERKPVIIPPIPPISPGKVPEHPTLKIPLNTKNKIRTAEKKGKIIKIPVILFKLFNVLI